MELGKIFIFIEVKTALFILIFCASFAFGQHDKLISRYKPGIMWYYNGLRPLKDSRLKKFDRLIVDITYNDWFSASHGLISNSWKSIGYNINFMFEERSKKDNRFSFGYGLRYVYSSILTDFNLTQGHGDLYVNQRTASDSYTVNKLREHSLVLPLELRFGKPKPKTFKVNLGGFIGYGFPVRQATIYKASKELSLMREASGIKYGVHLRIGGRSLAGFCSLQLGHLFRKNNAVYPFQAGISYSLF